jgi:hypothetical protein
LLRKSPRSFNIGGALGIAILSTVAVSRADDALSGVGREAEMRTMTEGFQTAFAVAVGLAALGALLAALLVRPQAVVEDPMERPERFDRQFNVKSFDEKDGGI